MSNTKEIIILSHELKECKLHSFEWIDKNLGWTFNWYDSKKELEKNCQTYGLFPDDFIEVNTNYLPLITIFLASIEKNTNEIQISRFLRWAENRTTLNTYISNLK